MSASAPNPPENKRKPLWFLLSLGVHGGILACLIFLIPATEIAVVSETGVVQSAPPVTASPERIQEVAEQIQATQADEVRSKVEELLSTEQVLADLQTQTQTEFAALAEEMSLAAPQKSADALATVTEAQARAEQAQTEAQAAVQAMNRARGTVAAAPEEKAAQESLAAAALAQASEAQARAKEAQTAATTAQVVAGQQMSFQGGLDEAKVLQSQAATAQTEANTKQDEATELKGAITAGVRQAERTVDAAAKAQRAVALGDQRIAEKEQTISQLTENVRQQQERLDQATASGNVKEAAQFQKGLAPVAGRLANAQKDLQKLQERRAADSARAVSAEEAAKKAGEELREAPAKLEAAQAAALKAQQEARALQTKAQTAVAKAFAAAPAAPLPADTETVGTTAAPSLEGQSFSDLYALAVQTEKSIAERFQAIRAAQVAVQKQIPLSEAQKYVQMALPLRAELPSEAAAARTAEALAAQNAAIEKALKELESMLALTRGMAWQASSTASGGQGMAVSVESMKLQAAQEAELAALAAENEGQAAVDLSGLMKQMAGGEHTGGKGFLPGGPQGTGGGLPGSGQRGGPAGAPAFPASGAVKDSLPGRKVHAGGYGEGAKWMFVDSWWVIGPFPNPQRRNIELRFPPESVVDLDASYAVDGGVVRWQFVQNAAARVQPPDERSYSIYYAYTELWFEEERDLWIAMGSDDYSKIWINDMMVWSSGMQHKAWKPNEGYRRVHFKQGLNRVLMRVENGQSVCMFSLMLGMQAER